MRTKVCWPEFLPVAGNRRTDVMTADGNYPSATTRPILWAWPAGIAAETRRREPTPETSMPISSIV